MYTRSYFTLFWSIPPDDTDWLNLNTSGVKRVMLPYMLVKTKPDVLAHLASLQVRVVVRLANGEPDPIDTICHVLQAAAHTVSIDFVIVGNEPDSGLDWRDGAPTWGQDRAYQHVAYVNAIVPALTAVGLQAVSPAWSMRSISEDDEPQPGVTTWREICEPAYEKCMACGAHIYDYAWQGVVDELRFKFALQEALEALHKPVVLDEVGVDRGSNVERMNAYIAMSRDLERIPALGARVLMFCPFVSNGDGHGYDPGFILRDTAAYQALGQYISNG